MFHIKRIIELERKVKNLERDTDYRDCQEGNHEFEMMGDVHAKCKHCPVIGEVVEKIKDNEDN